MAKDPGRKIAVLIDLNGTLHVDDKIIPGSIEALQRLRKNEKVSIKFVTNTTLESSSSLNERLTKLGIEFQPFEVFSSLSAARNMILKESLRPMLFLEEEALADFDGIDQSDPNAVIIGLAPSQFDYDTLNIAFRLLIDRPDARLIAIHMGRFYRKASGLTLGPGPFVTALQYATDTRIEVVGKPESAFFRSALETLNPSLTPADTVMVGDDVRDDALGAINAGMHAILVKTGKYREGDEAKICKESRNCVENFAAAVSLIERSLDNWSLLK